MQSKVKSSEINSTRVVLYLQKKPANLFKKETLLQVFSNEFCEISKNTYFVERL